MVTCISFISALVVAGLESRISDPFISFSPVITDVLSQNVLLPRLHFIFTINLPLFQSLALYLLISTLSSSLLSRSLCDFSTQNRYYRNRNSVSACIYVVIEWKC